MGTTRTVVLQVVLVLTLQGLIQCFEPNFADKVSSSLSQATDFTPPQCNVVSISGICPASASLCASTYWQFIANLTDGVNGTGIQRVLVNDKGQGNGHVVVTDMVGAEGENMTVVTYNASCCLQTVEVSAVDNAGNKGSPCLGQARVLTTAAPTTTSAVVSTTSTGGHTLTISHCLWISVVVSLLWK